MLGDVQKVREEALKPEHAPAAGVAGTAGYFQTHRSMQLASYTISLWRTKIIVLSSEKVTTAR